MFDWLSYAFFNSCNRTITVVFVFSFCDFLVHEFINLCSIAKCKFRGGADHGA